MFAKERCRENSPEAKSLGINESFWKLLAGKFEVGNVLCCSIQESAAANVCTSNRQRCKVDCNWP